MSLNFCSDLLYDELPTRMQNYLQANPEKSLGVDAMFNGMSEQEVEVFKENLLGNSSLASGKGVTFIAYVSAIKFVSLTMTGTSCLAAYKAVFPKRVAKMVANEEPTINFTKSAEKYRDANRLVNKIRDRLLVPVHLLYQSTYHNMVNVQASIANNSKAPFRDRAAAANSLLTHLAPPKPIEDLDEEDTKERFNSVMESLERSANMLVEAQLGSIKSGTSSAKELIAIPLTIDVKVEEL